MKIHVLFIKRHHALNDDPEAYACHDEQTRDENPDWPDRQVELMLKDCGTDMHGGVFQWIAIEVSGADIGAAMQPTVSGKVTAN